MTNGLDIAQDIAQGELFNPDPYDKANIVELIFQVVAVVDEDPLLAYRLLKIWKDDIFKCESCGKVFAWEDSVRIPGAIVDGKICDPDDTVCKHCRSCL